MNCYFTKDSEVILVEKQELKYYIKGFWYTNTKYLLNCQIKSVLYYGFKAIDSAIIKYMLLNNSSEKNILEYK